ncbi:hypothetical protein MKW92_052064 [Papaver armeniacum]|nr:hypothetical protein MKW92_052064 [Papaver armeniacum]
MVMLKRLIYSSLGGLVDKFMWECPNSSDTQGTSALPWKMTSMEVPNRHSRGDKPAANDCMIRSLIASDTQGTSAIPQERKTTSMEVPNKHSRGDNPAPRTACMLRPPIGFSGPARKDNFRHCKPNTSRPPFYARG